MSKLTVEEKIVRLQKHYNEMVNSMTTDYVNSMHELLKIREEQQ